MIYMKEKKSKKNQKKNHFSIMAYQNSNFHNFYLNIPYTPFHSPTSIPNFHEYNSPTNFPFSSSPFESNNFAWGPQPQFFQNYSQSQTFIAPYQNQFQPNIYPEVQLPVPKTQSNLSFEDKILRSLEELKESNSHMQPMLAQQLEIERALEDKVSQALKNFENTQGLDQDQFNSAF